MRKAQAAMEYLMTYGWAILIVVVVVAALFALGVFTPTGSRIPCSPCFSGGDMTYVDYSAGTLNLRTGPRQITVDDVTANGASTGIQVNGAVVPTGILDAGSTGTVTGIPITGTVALRIDYTVVSSGLSHTDSATIHNPT